MTDSYTIPAELMQRIYNTLQGYANPTTYDAPRVGGVVAGCQRGEKPTPERLTMGARWLLREIDRDVLDRAPPDWYTPEAERNEYESALLRLGTYIDGVRELLTEWDRLDDMDKNRRLLEVHQAVDGAAVEKLVTNQETKS